MKKNLFSISVLCLLVSGISAQGVDIESTELFKLKGKVMVDKLIYTDGTNYHFFGGKFAGYSGIVPYGVEFDASTLTATTQEPVFPKGHLNRGGLVPDNITAQFPINLNGDALIYYTDVTKGENNYSVWAQEYSVTSGVGTKTQIGETYNKGKVRVALAEDSSRVLVIHEPEQKSGSKTLVVALSNETHETVAQGEYTFDFNVDEVKLESVLLSAKGYAFLLFRFTDKDASPAVALYRMDLTSGSPAVEEVELGLSSSEYNIFEPSFFIKGDSFYALGFAGTSKDGADAVWKYQANIETLEEIANVFLPIPQETIEAFYTSKELKKATDKGKTICIENLTLWDAVIHDDGTLHIVSDVYQLVEKCSYSSRGMTCRYYYYNEDMLVLYLNAENELEWNARVPRSYLLIGTDFSQRQYVHADGKNLYLVYNDHEDNLRKEDREDLERVNGLKGMSTYVAIINESGNVEREKIVNNCAEDQAMLIPIATTPLPGTTNKVMSIAKSSYYSTKIKLITLTFK